MNKILIIFALLICHFECLAQRTNPALLLDGEWHLKYYFFLGKNKRYNAANIDNILCGKYSTTLEARLSRPGFEPATIFKYNAIEANGIMFDNFTEERGTIYLTKKPIHLIRFKWLVSTQNGRDSLFSKQQHAEELDKSWILYIDEKILVLSNDKEFVTIFFRKGFINVDCLYISKALRDILKNYYFE